MSIGIITDAKQIIKELEGLSPAEAMKRMQEMIEKTFYQCYGRYESASGRLFFEMYHHGDPDVIESGHVVFRKGETGNSKLEADMILNRLDAIKRFRELTAKGYQRVFAAITADDIARENAKLINPNADVLGIFYDGDAFIRVDQYGTNFSIQYGYDGHISRGDHEQSIEQVLTVINNALNNGYHRLGNAPSTASHDPFDDLII